MSLYPYCKWFADLPGGWPVFTRFADLILETAEQSFLFVLQVARIGIMENTLEPWRLRGNGTLKALALITWLY